MGETGRGRRLAALVVLIVAALAVAGTSPAPTRSPTIQTQTEGTIELSADHPMASVELTVTANAALLSDATNRTSVSVSRMFVVGETADQSIVVTAIQAIDGRDGPVVGSTPNVTESINAVCQRTGDCVRHFRITAVLAGSTNKPIKVGWRAVAETRTGTDEKPGVAPPGSVLSISAADQVASADRSAGASVVSEAIRVDPAHPRFVRTVDLVQPARGGSTLVGVLRSTITRDRTDTYSNRAFVSVETLDGKPLQLTATPTATDVALPACDAADGCRTKLRVVGGWLGGAPDDTAGVTWSLGASLFNLDSAATEKVGGLSLELGDLVVDQPVPMGATTGSIVIGGEKIKSQSINVHFDSGSVHGSTDGAGVFLQATFQATTKSRSGSTKEVLFRVGDTAISRPAGKDLSVVTALIPVTCLGGACSAELSLSAWVYGTPVDDVTLSWSMTPSVVVDPGITIDPGVVAGYGLGLVTDR